MKTYLILSLLVLAAMRGDAAPASAAAPGTLSENKNVTPSMGVYYKPQGGLVKANPYEVSASPTRQSRLDELVMKKLQQKGIQPSAPCSEAVFLRRVYLDLIGTVPTGKEAADYLLDGNPDKRRLLVDRLLQRDEYADYWSMKWCDLLRVKAEFPINLWPNAVQAYHYWIRASLRQNMTYDKFARELLTGNGSNFRVPQVNFFRATQNKNPQGVAQVVALTFMGTRAENWPKDKLKGMAAFFSQITFKSTTEWKEEIVYYDASNTNAVMTGVFPDGTQVKFPAGRDPRAIFADWLINPKNPWFTRNIANRAWSWLLGRGIIHEPDDVRSDNPPVNPELLDYLEKELIAANYDIKQLFRVIVNSQTYQRTCLPKTKNPDVEAYFACYTLRRLEAEVMIDALNQVTGTTEKYFSPIPEPFTFIPDDQRSIALSDASITSPFMEMFGRPPRDTGLENERNNKSTTGQNLHMLNSSHVQRKIEQGKNLQYLLQSKNSIRDIANGLYLMILSRWPTEAESRSIAEYSQMGHATQREVAIDVAWALVNSAEFEYRH
ncbi:MAG: DUF1553 domain-containing protein [Verrucomicrobiota bacterium]